jgi:hypothetical protein
MAENDPLFYGKEYEIRVPKKQEDREGYTCDMRTYLYTLTTISSICTQSLT